MLRKIVEKRDQNSTTISFVAVNSPPHVFVDQNETHFEIWGPMFTLLVEVARFLNYSLAGAVPDNTNIYPTLANVAPDFLLTPLWPRLRAFKAIILSKSRSIFNYLNSNN